MALEKEIKYFEKNKQTFLKQYRGKFALIKEESLIDVFATMEEAYQEGINRFGKEDFLVKQIVAIDPKEFVPSITIGNIHAHS